MTEPPSLAWVIGSGGLLGSHLAATLTRLSPSVHLWRAPVPRFRWDDPHALAGELELSVAEFARQAALHRQWMVFWAAGKGVVSSSEAVLADEASTWSLFLHLLAKHLRPADGRTVGTIFLASSAGGVYGDSPDQPLTESSEPRPISAYGRNKLAQEKTLEAWVQAQSGMSYLLGRISNLYGAGQCLAKAQGLISHISRCLIHNKPLHLYVPLHTIRDYIPAEACADHIVTCVRYLAAQTEAGCASRGHATIIASEEEASLAQIVATFARISHRQPRLICSPSPIAALQPSRLQFRSRLWPHLGRPPGCSLSAGIKKLHEHHLALYLQGRLPPAA